MTSPHPDRDDDSSVDVEAAWADIVAHWDTDKAREGAWPDAEDTAKDAPAQPSSGGAVADRERDGERSGSDDVVEDWGVVPSHVGGEPARAAAAAPEPEDDDDGDHYIPPEPPPLPRGDLFTTLAWGGVLGAPLFFLFCAIFWRSVPQVLIVGAIAAFVGGFLALVLRMPDRRDPDDHDDGAVV